MHATHRSRKVALAAVAAADTLLASPAWAWTSADLRAATHPSTPLLQPIAPSARVDPDSPAMIAALAEVALTRGLVVSVSQWTVPVYGADATTPLATVTVLGRPPAANLDPSFVHNRVTTMSIRIPAQAQADDSSDAHMTIVDPGRRCQYDFYGASKVNGRWQAAWVNRIALPSSGIYPYGLSNRASGFAALAGGDLAGRAARRRDRACAGLQLPAHPRRRPGLARDRERRRHAGTGRDPRGCTRPAGSDAGPVDAEPDDHRAHDRHRVAEVRHVLGRYRGRGGHLRRLGAELRAGDVCRPARYARRLARDVPAWNPDQPAAGDAARAADSGHAAEGACAAGLLTRLAAVTRRVDAGVLHRVARGLGAVVHGQIAGVPRSHTMQGEPADVP